ncbi:MAG TPA: hypothetical protein VMS88_01825, partial [Terriglobales bacterium]|nr:hypothetical protein [Terriglobales bacterium]
MPDDERPSGLRGTGLRQVCAAAKGPLVARFPELQLNVTLEGFSEREATAAARAWCAELGNTSGGPKSPAYTIAMEDGTVRARSGGGWRPRLVSDGEGDRVFLRDGVIAIGPGRRRAVLRRRAGCEPVDALETALMHAASLEGVGLLHAAAFELDGQRVLAVGASGSGKSTLAAAALTLGGRIVSDDAVLLGRDRAGALTARTVCRDLRLRAASVAVVSRDLRALLVRSSGADGERWLLRRESAPGRFAESFAPGVALRISLDRRRRGCSLRALSGSELLATLIASASPLLLSARYREESEGLTPLLASAADSMRGFEV